MMVAKGRVHSPIHVGAIRDRQKWPLAVPVARTEAPRNAHEVQRQCRVRDAPHGEPNSETSPCHVDVRWHPRRVHSTAEWNPAAPAASSAVSFHPMWMNRVMPWISRVASRGYYRVTVGGAMPPSVGPALFVANHTNSLLDTAFVVVASQRPVRFMAKAPLFTYPGLGWLVKGVGSVPVYRAQDDPKLVAQNLDVFRAVYAAIAQGDAVGIFPEGISHSASHLQPLKTGAARIALGAAAELGRSFPIIPIGMVFADRRTFRSKAGVVVGESCKWNDLAARGPKDREAVRELTRRIEASMRTVTLNLHTWRDESLVRIAEDVWSAEFGGEGGTKGKMERLEVTTDALSKLRLGEDNGWRALARELRGHDRVLGRIGLTAHALRVQTGAKKAVPWLASQIPWLVMMPIAAVGVVLFWIPREIAGQVGTTASTKEGDDSVPTFRVMYGFVVFGVWFLLLAVATGLAFGWLAGIATFILLPSFAFLAIRIGESQQFVWQAVRRFFILRKYPERIAALRQRQHALAQRMKDLLRDSSA